MAERDDSRRPPVTVAMPFHGGPDAARGALAALCRLRLRPGDEIVVADNTADGHVIAAARDRGVRAVHAPAERSSYYARNVAAEHARTDWLLFLDADCRPAPTLIEDYFAEPIDARCGIAAGGVRAAAGSGGLVTRYAASRGHLDTNFHVERERRAAGTTSNLLVRRDAWEQVGGFHERLRSGEDVAFCWRVQDAGWTLVYRPAAVVEHRHRGRIHPMARQAARWASGRAWLNRRHPDADPGPQLGRELARAAAGMAVWTLTGRFERAAFKGLDAVMVAATAAGRLIGNASVDGDRGLRRGDGDVCVMTDAFPALSETFIANEVRALRDLGFRVRVESSGRPQRPNRAALRELGVSYLEDDGLAQKLRDVAWLAARHPLRCTADLHARRRWRAEEDPFPLRALAPPVRRLLASGERHVHAHFAAGAALNAMRIAALTGVRWSVTAHAYDIYQRPRNLTEKLRRAAFVTSGCEYTVGHLRAVAGPDRAHRVHKIVMGVDGDAFRRSAPHAGGGLVVAVGRLVEKKGFADLVDAAALLRGRDAPLERIVIVGDGPLRRDLGEMIDSRNLGGAVELVSWLDPAGVRELLERAALLAMPCVVAGDGDRDSMPVVVKEAMAMELPVVATDEVGLPELVRAEWGRLVPPHDPGALAAAIGELLAMDDEERAALGRAGRTAVLAIADVRTETAKLARLIGASEHQAALADGAAHDGDHLGQIVEQVPGRQ